jgi:DNA repair exonuclease SbcCD nuclease subunit
MLVVILGDIHIGVRNDSAVFNELQRKFYTEVLFPYMEEHKLDTIVQLGDMFDRRKYINFNSLNLAKDYLFDPMLKKNITCHTLVGNHDIAFRNTLSVNSQRLLLGGYPNVIVHDKPCTIDFDGLPIDLIPWICEENTQEISDFITESKSSFCAGHFELAGFEMDRNNWCREGQDPATLSKYELVIAGHFHHRSRKSNILYAGVPIEHTWADWNDPKGFHVLDTDTRELEFIKNPHTIYVKISYNDDDLFFDDVQKKDFSEYTGKYVKVVTIKKNNAFLFETFMDNLSKANPVDITTVEDFTDDNLPGSEDDIDQADDTMAIIDKVVDALEIDLQKDKLKSIIKEIYTEALAVE